MSHHCPISLSKMTAATAVFVTALSSCSDLALPSEESNSLADLLLLSQQPNAPEPPTVSFWVSNTRQSVERITHPDNFNTLYLQLEFPANSLESLNGSVLGANDSLFVTIDPRPDAYGFTMSPSGIEFVAGASPTATFSFSVYGDATSGAISAAYGSSADFVAALEVWYEATVDRWEIAPGSGSAGADAVRASLESSGRFVLAATR